MRDKVTMSLNVKFPQYYAYYPFSDKNLHRALRASYGTVENQYSCYKIDLNLPAEIVTNQYWGISSDTYQVFAAYFYLIYNSSCHFSRWFVKELALSS